MVVVWDEQSIHHMLVVNGCRAIGLDEIEEVLSDPTATRRRLRGGRRMYRGRTTAGRRLTVVAEVVEHRWLMPRTAWETTR